MKRIALFATCAACDGHGRVPGQPGGPRMEVCGECRGKGFLPTQEGRAIIGLVKTAKVRGLLPEAGV
jgi:DnaJ-class molecular chaperone